MRLIDGDALIELINGGYDLDFDEVPETKRELLRMIMEQPTVDAVPVVRCKDCKHFKQSDAWDRIEMWCDYHHGDFDTWESLENDEGFCSWAERKEE